MAGAVEAETKEMLPLYVERLRLAAKTFEQNDLIGLIEPINKYALPNYFLNSYDRGWCIIYCEQPHIHYTVVGCWSDCLT